MTAPPALDALLHQPARTRLVALLAAAPQSFTELKAALGVTDGNLDAHLKKLSAAGYLESSMAVDGRPRTIYALSPSGRRAVAAYLQALETLVALARRGSRPSGASQ